MIKQAFLGKKPSDFQINSTIKAFIISESFVWSAWNFVMPIFAIFAATQIPGSNISVAATVVSFYLIVRVVFELIIGRFLTGSKERRKYIFAFLGTFLISLGYIGFSLAQSIPMIYLFYGLMGIGMGIASPAKNSLFSIHLDKNKETMEWGIYDATVFVGMAIAAAIGGVVANQYGFKVLFLIASAINFLGLIPYFLYIHKHSNQEELIN